MRSNKSPWIVVLILVVLILMVLFPTLGKIIVYGLAFLPFVFLIVFHSIPSKNFDPPKRNRNNEKSSDD